MIWHILTTAPQREFAAQDALKRLGLSTMIPVEYRWHDARKAGHAAKKGKTEKEVRAAKKGKTEKEVRAHPLWPRYVFVGCDRFQTPWHEIYAINHAGRQVITGALYRNGMPYALSHTERLHIGALTDVAKPQVPPDPSRRLYPGDRVRIIDGPFNGQPAQVHKTAKNGESVRVMVSLFGTLTEATVPVAMVEAA